MTWVKRWKIVIFSYWLYFSIINVIYTILKVGYKLHWTYPHKHKKSTNHILLFCHFTFCLSTLAKLFGLFKLVCDPFKIYVKPSSSVVSRWNRYTHVFIFLNRLRRFSYVSNNIQPINTLKTHVTNQASLIDLTFYFSPHTKRFYKRWSFHLPHLPPSLIIIYWFSPQSH